jgi:enamine deaminase RidA (YjgF/YER057c/UK114 family)
LRTVRNPETIHPPLGHYVHQVEVRNPEVVLFIAGQVGMQLDGSVPKDAIAQLDAALANVVRNLEAAGLSTTDLTKITTYVVGTIDREARAATVRKHLGDHKPTSTLVFVAALASPDYLVEVDAWAAR